MVVIFRRMRWTFRAAFHRCLKKTIEQSEMSGRMPQRIVKAIAWNKKGFDLLGVLVWVLVSDWRFRFGDDVFDAAASKSPHPR